MKETVGHRIKYLLSNGKNSKVNYYIRSYWRKYFEPATIYRRRLGATLAKAAERADYAELQGRATYYCKLEAHSAQLPDWAPAVARIPITKQKVYFFDLFRFARWFPPRLRVVLCPGDITYVPEHPSIVKSRPICADNANSVLMKLNAVRHFIFIKDKTPWEKKQPRAVFMGKIRNKPERLRFMGMYGDSDVVDCGYVDRRPIEGLEEYQKPKLTIREQLRYRFVVCLEGNDVASNLKWVMSSNSLAVMPRPKYETWFMEGNLEPDVHYVEISSDFSDLEEKLGYYNAHPEEAARIIENAHKYVDKFKDGEGEKLVSLMVLQRYFEATQP